ncbi:MAG: hypothetical protein E7627_00545 [Ruminococcaceae bacterium]|nr:hypothetical protein [Oscillospiraceae bacterium]
MKRLFLMLILLLITAFCVIPASAAYDKILSPALGHLSSDEVMIKSGIVSGNISFTSDDFARAIGREVDSITVTALPPASEGILMYGSAPVGVNQTISQSGIKYLYFVPAANCKSSSFRFKAGGEYSISCILKYSDSYNSAPTVSQSSDSVPVWTQMDITTFGKLGANDPEGDELTFDVTEYPKNGLVEILNKNTGDYRYTPYDGVTGKDSFTYVARDEWGNYSEEKTVLVEIDKAAAELVFEDMTGHWAHNAALVIAAEDAMAVESKNGLLYFNPDEPITREEFLVTVMKVLGADDIDPAVTVFADDGKISKNASGYVARAYNLGVINGRRENGLLFFNPTDEITRAEAAVILNSIIGAKTSDVVPVFADSQSVPAWAKSDIYALTSAGVFSGTGNGFIEPNEILSRAQAAQILFTVKKMYVD